MILNDTQTINNKFNNNTIDFEQQKRFKEIISQMHAFKTKQNDSNIKKSGMIKIFVLKYNINLCFNNRPVFL